VKLLAQGLGLGLGLELLVLQRVPQVEVKMVFEMLVAACVVVLPEPSGVDKELDWGVLLAALDEWQGHYYWDSHYHDGAGTALVLEVG
jgi:hypothetical protein